MKNRNLIFPILSMMFFVLFSNLLFAQNPVKSFKEDLKWNKATETKTIILDVKKGAKIIEMEFEGNITEGTLEVIAFDPEGNKVAGFSLVATGEENSNVEVEALDWANGEGEAWETKDGETWSTTNSNSNSNSNSNTNSNSDSDGESEISVTSGSGSNSSSVRIKSKSKNKNKNKTSKGYSVVSTSSDSKSAKGMMKKKLSDPIPGNWKIVLTLENVTGNLMADIEQD